MNNQSLLQEFNLKATPQRLEIVNLLYDKGHLTIDNLYVMLQDKFPSLSLATIYKNINKMINNNFLSEVNIPNQKSVYELVKKEHSHIVCSKCNEIIDINLNISNIINDAENKTSYQIEQSSIIFNGICPKCNH